MLLQNALHLLIRSVLHYLHQPSQSQQFAEKHSEELSNYWSWPLDTAQGHTVNHTTNEAWFNLLGDTITTNDIAKELQYGVDGLVCNQVEAEERSLGLEQRKYSISNEMGIERTLL